MDVDTLLFQQFQRFVNKFHKKYSSVNEFLARFEINAILMSEKNFAIVLFIWRYFNVWMTGKTY